MKLPIIKSQDEQQGKNSLAPYYANNLIPAEKKPYLTKLRDSIGPYMALEAADGKSSSFMQDAASQIATLGFGFNPPCFFGPSTSMEAWLNLCQSSMVQQIRESFKNFLQRQLAWPQVNFRICHSGAEANETALGECYLHRRNKKAKKVLAFEGSFHGRMMVTLSATWNKAKREPFEWPGYETVYVTSPELNDDHLVQPISTDWRQIWGQGCKKNFNLPAEWRKGTSSDAQLAREAGILETIRGHFHEQDIFAVIIEPMQCEGGDKYISDRFMTGLLLLAKSYGVSVIFDEVQTGFHLGQNFFWHRQLGLKDAEGNDLRPDYLVCAKKAQVGLVISHHSVDLNYEEFQVASFMRGVVHAQLLGQSGKQILALEKEARAHLAKLISKYADFIHRPRANGMAFAFDLKDEANFNKIIDLRFPHGLLYYNAGTHTLRFRLNVAYGPQDINFLFQELDHICSELFLKTTPQLPKEVVTDLPDERHLYDWHELYLGIKLDLHHGKEVSFEQFWNKGLALLKLPENLKVELITEKNISKLEANIVKLQKEVYEPARQTDLSLFQTSAKNPKSICLAIIDKKPEQKNGQEIAAMTFAAPLKTFPLERGVRRDPHFHSDNNLYVIDTTVSPRHGKLSLGRSLKYLLTLAATLKGIDNIKGRNRFLLARTMWNINLSLGAYEQNYLHEDYPDFEETRDAIFYAIPTKWEKGPTSMSQALLSPLSISGLTLDFMRENLPTMVNKVCLSNFVSKSYLDNFKFLVELAPESLRHTYSASGQSECVDKIAKSIWYNTKKNIKTLTFEGHFFGHGSFLARGLGQMQEALFPHSILPHPTEYNMEEVLEATKRELETGKIMSVWIEPLRQRFMDQVPLRFLKSLRKLCQGLSIPLVYNETASAFYRYQQDHFFASNHPDLTPDAMMAYGGGQIGVVYLQEKLFVSKPLMLISTWDGDELSLATFAAGASYVVKKHDEVVELRRIFGQVLKGVLEDCNVSDASIVNGCGYFKGAIPVNLQKYFNKTKDSDGSWRYLIMPNTGAMSDFIRDAGEISF